MIIIWLIFIHYFLVDNAAILKPASSISCFCSLTMMLVILLLWNLLEIFCYFGGGDWEMFYFPMPFISSMTLYFWKTGTRWRFVR